MYVCNTSMYYGKKFKLLFLNHHLKDIVFLSDSYVRSYISRFTKTYIHKTGKYGIKLKVPPRHTKEVAVILYYNIGIATSFSSPERSFFELLGANRFPTDHQFSYIHFIFLSISTFYIVFYSTWEKSNNIVLSSVYIKIYLTYIIKFFLGYRKMITYLQFLCTILLSIFLNHSYLNRKTL